MYGTAGYIGTKKAYPVRAKGLFRLVYCGYDSAGVALVSNSRNLKIHKDKDVGQPRNPVKPVTI